MVTQVFIEGPFVCQNSLKVLHCKHNRGWPTLNFGLQCQCQEVSFGRSSKLGWWNLTSFRPLIIVWCFDSSSVLSYYLIDMTFPSQLLSILVQCFWYNAIIQDILSHYMVVADSYNHYWCLWLSRPHNNQKYHCRCFHRRFL